MQHKLKDFISTTIKHYYNSYNTKEGLEQFLCAPFTFQKSSPKAYCTIVKMVDDNERLEQSLPKRPTLENKFSMVCQALSEKTVVNFKFSMKWKIYISNTLLWVANLKKTYKNSKVDAKEYYEKSKERKRKEESAPRASGSSNKLNHWSGERTVMNLIKV